jgi:hypothetical protein
MQRYAQVGGQAVKLMGIMGIMDPNGPMLISIFDISPLFGDGTICT